MKPHSFTGATFITTGTLTGAAISSTVGGIGIAGSFGAVGIGATTVTAVGTVLGAATYGTFTGIIQGDSKVLTSMGIGAMSGFAISNMIGNIGLTQKVNLSMFPHPANALLDTLQRNFSKIPTC